MPLKLAITFDNHLVKKLNLHWFGPGNPQVWLRMKNSGPFHVTTYNIIPLQKYILVYSGHWKPLIAIWEKYFKWHNFADFSLVFLMSDCVWRIPVHFMWLSTTLHPSRNKFYCMVAWSPSEPYLHCRDHLRNS